MLYMFHCTDKPGAAAVRAENRPTHLAYLESLGERLVTAGPLLTEDGQAAVGSLLVIDCADAADAKSVADNDPYAKAGLFERVEILPWRRVFPKG